MRRWFVCTFLSVLVAGGTALGQNMLNNPGFETGLMCYYNWIWSVTGVDFAGDYQFVLSNDAHTGNYSAELICGGTDCDHAAYISDSMPELPSQGFAGSIYSKCPTGTVASIFFPGGTLAYFPLVCNGDWAPNTFAFTASPAGGDLYWEIFLFGNTWLKVDDMVLTYADGTAPAHTVQHPGKRSVGISGQHVTVDGAPFFSLGFFGVTYNDLPRVAATGANTVNGLGVYPSTDCYNFGQPSYLDEVYNLGMNFVPDGSSTARVSVPATGAAVQTFGPHLANIAWLLADEPDLSQVAWEYIQPATFLSDAASARAQTTLPLMADMQRGSYGSYSDIAPYNGSADIWMAEPYGPGFGSVTHAVNLFNSVQSRPVWLAQDDVGASLLVPKAYWAVIAGVTGIHYFGWDSFKNNPDDVAAATQVFTEIKGLQNAIFGQPMDALVTQPSGIASMSRFDPGTGNAYILSANSVDQVVAGNFAVQGLAAGQTVNVLYENRTITAGAGSFSDTFSGVSRHVYQMNTAATALTANLLSETGATANRDWKLQVYNTGIGAANATQIAGITLTETGGTVCTPTFAPGTFPVILGAIAPSQSATGDVIINFTGCTSTSKFTMKATVAANDGATTATIVRNNQRM